MKFIHISDLHLGKKVYEYSMIEEQRNALWQVLSAIDVHKPDCLLIAGDIYDKPVPTIEAVELFDSFLMELSKRKLNVFIISGNHDSSERIAFGAEIFANGRIYISKPYSGNIRYVDLKDDYGMVRVHLIPFVKPAFVRKYYPQCDITDYNSALKTVIENMELLETDRNVVLVHQFITGAERSQSEEAFLGGLDNVEYDIFDRFDYVALGHIHKPQPMGRQQVRYSGAPVKYAIDEINQIKSMTVLELKEKGQVTIDTIPFTPVHDMRQLRGTYMELTDRNNYIDTKTDDYIHVILTDEEDVPDALRKLRVVYPNILRLEYDNKRTRENKSVVNMESVRKKNPVEYIMELYQLQNNEELSEEQMKLVEDMLEEI